MATNTEPLPQTVEELEDLVKIVSQDIKRLLKVLHTITTELEAAVADNYELWMDEQLAHVAKRLCEASAKRDLFLERIEELEFEGAKW